MAKRHACGLYQQIMHADNRPLDFQGRPFSRVGPGFGILKALVFTSDSNTSLYEELANLCRIIGWWLAGFAGAEIEHRGFFQPHLLGEGFHGPSWPRTTLLGW